MRTRGQIAALVAAALSASAACKALQLDLVIGEAGADGDTNQDGIVAPVPCSAAKPWCPDAGTPVCDEGAGVCVQCLGDEQCPKNAKHCDPTFHECYACTADAGCSEGMVCNRAIPRCATACDTGDAANACLGLASAGEPCAASTWGFPFCVECLEEGHMSSACITNNKEAGTYCWGNPSGACGCMDDSDCPNNSLCGPASGPMGLRFCN